MAKGLVKKLLCLGDTEVIVKVMEKFDKYKFEIRCVIGTGRTREIAEKNFSKNIEKYMGGREYSNYFIPKNSRTEKNTYGTYICSANVLFMKELPFKITKQALLSYQEKISLEDLLSKLDKKGINFKLKHA